MGILSFLALCGFRNADAASFDGEKIVIDLATFQVGATRLGSVPSASDSFSAALTNSEVSAPKGQGIELGTKNRNLDYVFITLGEFKGAFTVAGKSVLL